MTTIVAGAGERIGEAIAEYSRGLRVWYDLADPQQRYLADCLIVGALWGLTVGIARQLTQRRESPTDTYQRGYRSGYLQAIQSLVTREGPVPLTQVAAGLARSGEGGEPCPVPDAR